jgi:ATP-dependent DNA helicase 2 subunit 1
MREWLPLCGNLIESFLKSKVIASANDQVGIVLYGTKESRNDFGLDHVHVLQQVQQLSAKLIRDVQKAWVGASDTTLSDLCYEGSEKHRGKSLKFALWTCSHLLEKFSKRDVDKRVFLFTNDDDPCGGDDLLRKQTIDRLGTLQDTRVDFQVYPLGRSFGSEFWSTAMARFHKDEEMGFLEQQQLKLGDTFKAVRRKVNRKRRAMTTQIKIGPQLHIEVEYFLMLTKQKKISKNIHTQTNALLKTSTAYVCAQTGEVLEEDPLKGLFVRGQQIVTSPMEWLEMKEVLPAGLHLLGFKPVSCLKPFYQVRAAGFVYPNETDFPGSCRLFLSFHEKMRELDQMAICSFSSSRSSGSNLVALVAQQEAKDECGNQVEPPGMHVIYLPYADDVRFPEENLTFVKDPKKVLSSRPHFCSEDQLAKASALVDALYLEDFEVGSVQNPALQRHYEILQCEALGEDPTEILGELRDESLPSPALLGRPEAQRAIAAFQAGFREMCTNPKKRKLPSSKD